MTLLSDSIPPMQPFRDPGPFGTEEGDVCRRERCKGVIIIPPPEGCSCHISPPCAACVGVKPYCPKCLWELEDEE